MKFRCAGVVSAAVMLLVLGWMVNSGAHEPHEGEVQIGDQPALPGHISQEAIEDGAFSVEELMDIGEVIFTAMFNTLDGAGRPESTGVGTPRKRIEFPFNFNRSSAPDANSCSGCHNLPRAGGGGDNVANVFVLAQRNAFITSIDPSVANERNTLGMWASGVIELLAREMSTELQRIRDSAIEAAQESGEPVTLPLVTKGVDFGEITANPDGTVDTSGVEGVDPDLVIKPFNQKGTVVSLRVFTNNAMNHHHGMQSAERFGFGTDPDGDGVTNELTPGDITAAVIFQATLPAPIRIIPRNRAIRRAIRRGEQLFNQLQCTTCHKPFLVLDNPIFTEPNPFNPPGNLRPQDVSRPLRFDIAKITGLEKTRTGKVIVPAFTDLKRHHMGDVLNNEQLVQDGVPTDMFITKKLWGFADEPPFLHHGRATTITEAILAHGGEAQAARDAFAALSPTEQAQVVEFLKTLRVRPPGVRASVVDENLRPTTLPSAGE